MTKSICKTRVYVVNIYYVCESHGVSVVDAFLCEYPIWRIRYNTDEYEKNAGEKERENRQQQQKNKSKPIWKEKQQVNNSEHKTK